MPELLLHYSAHFASCCNLHAAACRFLLDCCACGAGHEAEDEGHGEQAGAGGRRQSVWAVRAVESAGYSAGQRFCSCEGIRANVLTSMMPTSMMPLLEHVHDSQGFKRLHKYRRGAKQKHPLQV